MLQTQITINDEALNLMELSEMSVVQILVPEDSVDGKELMRFEGLLVSYTLEVARRDSSGVSSEDVFESFLRLPLVVVAQTAEASLLMDVPHCLKVLLVVHLGHFRVRNEEGVMSISRRMSLWLKQRVEIPEGALDVPVSLHFLKAHLQQDLDELLLGLHEQVQVAVLNFESF